MSNNDRAKPSYYERNRETRKAYQRAYYDEKKAVMRRKREVDHHLNPEKRQKYLDYQRKYYLEHRDKQLAERRKRYWSKKFGLNPES